LKKIVNNLFVKEFPDEYDENMLKQLFSPYGELNNILIMKNEVAPASLNDEKKGKSFAFVCYKDPESADKALR